MNNAVLSKLAENHTHNYTRRHVNTGSNDDIIKVENVMTACRDRYLYI